ncbi:MAG TPA: nucleotidyltransferase family protein [Pyrinomonadaceae bacterium]
MRKVVSRPEHEVLFCAARRELDAEQQAKLRQLLKQNLDWNYLFTTANTHGLVPLLQKHLHSLNSAPIPIDFRSRVRRQSLANAQNVLHLVGKQLKLFRLFNDSHIAVAIFKGSALAQSAYGDFSLRQAGDIDVLISRGDFDRARLLLESLGYQMTPQLTPAQLSSHLASHCEIQFVRDDWFTVVDLHWALAPKSFVFKMDTDELLSRLQPVTIAGAEIETLATEDLIVYLPMHGAKHLWRALEWISSLGELIRSEETIAWDKVIKRAEKAYATRMLALGLRLSESLSNLNVPAEVWRAVDGDESSKRMAQQTLAEIFNVSTAAVSSETNLYNLKIMDRKRDAFISALRAIFVPTLSDWHALHLPPSLHSLYYAYRPLRLSKAYSSALWRKLGSRGAACL